MVAINMTEIQRDVAGYLKRVEAGETLLVVRDNRPVAEIRPVAPEAPGARPFGLCAGEFTVPDDFNAPLPDDVLAAFEGL